ncbi:MAG: hypothetical protein ACXVY8_07695 [Gaiellaceae bacterium]
MRRLGLASATACALVAASSALAAAGPALKTYVGQTEWQHQQEIAYMKQPVHRKGVHSAFTSTMKVSSKGIETVLLSGPCGSIIHHSDAGTPPIAVRNGAFRTDWAWGRVTARKITGTFSTDGTKRCTTRFTLRAR